MASESAENVFESARRKLYHVENHLVDVQDELTDETGRGDLPAEVTDALETTRREAEDALGRTSSNEVG